VHCSEGLDLIILRRILPVMGRVMMKIVNIDQQMLKTLAEKFKQGLSLEEIAKQLDIDTISARRLLKLLGYSVEA
jgi:hypothetical protein